MGCGDDDGGVNNNNNNANANDNTNQNNNNSANPVCGDGTVDSGEECDNGTANSDTTPDACRENCMNASCGDNVTDTGEDCDDGNTTNGDGCSAQCVTESPTCGDGTIDNGEVCDDGNNTDGDGCSANCLSNESCGNDIADTAAGEDCDASDLDNQDCQSQGFVGGTLDCGVACAFDTSGCHNCGNNIIDTGEVCDGTAVFNTDCSALGLGHTFGTVACTTGCGFDTGACTSTPWPAPGDVIVTEIMQNPAVLPDSDGEWFEVYNAGSATFQLGNCTVEGGGGTESFLVDADLTIAPAQSLVFSVDATVNQGFTADFQWGSGFSLNNSSDTVRLVCDGTTIDEVSYDNGATFPDSSGMSMSLDPGSYTAAANDNGANWCDGFTNYNGDFGTPGAVNPACPVPVTYTIDFCLLQFPLFIDDPEGTDISVYSRLYIAGLTDLSGVNDPAAEVIGYVGYGPDGTDPATDTNWVWVAGTPNASYGPASPGYEANNDEYQASLTIPSPPGSYDFAFRFSGDSGATFTYCDGGAGSSNGYDPADAGQMTSRSGGPPPNLYFSEYVEGGSNNKAVEIYNAESTTVNLASCVVNVYANGASAPTNDIPLSGTLAAGDVLVVCDDNFVNLGLCDVTDNGGFWNGDDAIELVCATTTLDVIGQIGFDPGTEWIVGGVSTLNETLRRACTVTSGDSDGSDVFDPSAEWAAFGQDNFADLGVYTCP